MGLKNKDALKDMESFNECFSPASLSLYIKFESISVLFPSFKSMLTIAMMVLPIHILYKMKEKEILLL